MKLETETFFLLEQEYIGFRRMVRVRGIWKDLEGALRRLPDAATLEDVLLGYLELIFNGKITRGEY